MKLTATALALALSTGAPAFAAGDAAAGEKVFAKCATCHVIANEAGEVLGGKAAKTGPNLYGMPGRVAGTYPEFKYGEDMIALGATGFVWNEADFTEYVADPTKFLKAKLDDKGAKGKMQFKLAKAEDAANVWAYISSLSPAVAPATE
jgi:cytochrome c